MKKVIIIMLALTLVIAGCKNNKPTPSASVSPSSTDIVTAMPTATEYSSELVTPSLSPSPTAKATPTYISPSKFPTLVPTSQGTKSPLQVAAGDAVVIRIKLDTGIGQSSSPVMKFDEGYQITDANALGTIDIDSVKMLVYVTNYYGNSAVFAFAEVQGKILFNDFVFSSDGKATVLSSPSSLDIFVDSNKKAYLTWDSKSATVAADASAELKNTFSSKTVTMTAQNMSVLEKDTLIAY